MKVLQLRLATLTALLLCVVLFASPSSVAAHGGPHGRLQANRGHGPAHGRQHVQDQRDLTDMHNQAKRAKDLQKQIIKRNQYNPHRPKPTKAPLAKRQNPSGAPTAAATVTTGTSTLTFSRPTTITETLFTTSTFTNTFYSTRFSTIKNCLLVLCQTTTSTIYVPTSTSVGSAVVPTATNTITNFVPATTTFAFTSTIGKPAVTTAATNDAASFCPRCTGALIAAYLPILGCVCI